MGDRMAWIFRVLSRRFLWWQAHTCVRCWSRWSGSSAWYCGHCERELGDGIDRRL